MTLLISILIHGNDVKIWMRIVNVSVPNFSSYFCTSMQCLAKICSCRRAGSFFWCIFPTDINLAENIDPFIFLNFPSRLLSWPWQSLLHIRFYWFSRRGEAQQVPWYRTVGFLLYLHIITTTVSDKHMFHLLRVFWTLQRHIFNEVSLAKTQISHTIAILFKFR